MVKRGVSAIILCLALVGAAAAQIPSPQPTPEHKALDYFLGTWDSAGEMKASPFGPGGRMTGTETCERLGAFHVVCRSRGSGPMGSMEGVAVLSYEAASKAYTYYAVNSLMPDAEFARGVRQGSDWRWSSEAKVAGKTIQSSFTIVEQGPSAYSFKWDMMGDGGGKTTIMEGKATRK